MLGNAVATFALTKRFGKKVAVDSIDLAVPEGSVFGFLGPNGAGKTTTIRMLTGLIFPDGGRIELLGRPVPKDLSHVLPRVGSMIEGPGFIPYLTGEENLRRLLCAAGFRARESRSYARSALERVGLGSAADKRAKQYSLGMKQRLSLAWALAVPRELYILDEPTNGLDPTGMREIRELIASLASGGATVLVSSHLLTEVEQICTHVAMMSEGRIIRMDALENFVDNATTSWTVGVAEPERAKLLITNYFEGARVTEAGEGLLSVEFPQEHFGGGELNRYLVERGIEVSLLRPNSRSLEDVFLDVVGKGFDVH